MPLLTSLRRRILPSLEEERADPLDWRDRVLRTILAVALTLGSFTAIPSIWLAWREAMYWTVVMDVGALAVTALLTFHSRIPFRARALGLLGLCYLLGVWFLLVVGLVSQIYLMAVPILAAMLLGLRVGVVALVVTALTLGVVGFAVSADLPYPGQSDERLKWALISLNFLFIDAVLTLSVGVLLHRLEHSLAKEQAASASLAQLARAVEQSHESILISDAAGEVVYANRAAAELLGAPETAEGPHRLSELQAGGDARGSLAGAIAAAREWRGSILRRHADGTDRVLESVVAPLRDDDGRLLNFVAVMRDVTNERAMEARLRQGQKLEAIGTLTGGIAHDFNNIVASILGVAELAKLEHPSAEVGEGLDQIVVACYRARDIVRQMMAFSRHSASAREPLVLASVVEEALPLLRASIPSTIAFRTELASRGRALVQRSDVHQVLMNLASNGAHAMLAKGTGTLRFRLGSVVAGEELAARVPMLHPGSRYLCLEVEDDGHGIPAAHLDRIFDPFFTTKSQAEGTGLGLASVHGIVRALDGGIGVRSQPGKGTTFSVYLPEVAPTVDAPVAEGPSATPGAPFVPPRGALLLVDDEPMLLDVQAIMLRRAGYAVTATRDSVEALEMLRAAPFRFDLVVTDLSMPRVSGLDLIRAARTVRPEMRAVLVSGFSDSARQEELATVGVDAFLQKPYTQAELLRLVRRVLE